MDEKHISIWQIPEYLLTLLYHFKDKVGGKKYYKDKTTAMIGNQCPFMEGFENIIKKIMDLAVHLPSRADLLINARF